MRRPRNRRPAKGTLDANGYQVGIAIRLDHNTFDAVRIHAIAINLPFVEMVRIFVREGLARRAAQRQAA